MAANSEPGGKPLVLDTCPGDRGAGTGTQSGLKAPHAALERALIEEFLAGRGRSALGREIAVA
jgi:hypothetical protein